MTKQLADFIGKYPVSKTLRFELKPQGKTAEWIERNGILERDEMLAADYKQMKQIIDNYHRWFLGEVLDSPEIDIDWHELEAAIESFQAAEGAERYDARGKLEKVQEQYRKKLVALLEKPEKVGKPELPGCNALFSADFIAGILPDYYEDEQATIDVICKFEKFISYFSGFFENRKLMYTSEEKAGSIATRLVNENFSTFYQNRKLYLQLKAQRPEVLAACERELESSKIGEFGMDSVFELDFFNRVLSQRGIDFYNLVLGGCTEPDGKSVRGLNQFLNEAHQQGRLGEGAKRVKLAPLYKQILSERETLPFVLDKVQTDNEASTLIADAIEKFNDVMLTTEGKAATPLASLLLEPAALDPEKIYIDKKNITQASRIWHGDWASLDRALDRAAEARLAAAAGKKAPTKKMQAEAEKWRKQKQFSVAELERACASMQYSHTGGLLRSVGEELVKLATAAKAATQGALQTCSRFTTTERRMLESDEIVDSIKDALDAMLDYHRTASLLTVDRELDRDGVLYSEHDAVVETTALIIPVYNKVRNYITQKPYSEEKFKLNFNVETLAAGWDINKETTNLCTMFTKDGLYYLGIIDKSAKKCLEGAPAPDAGEKCYRKMVYKLLPGPNKMLPKVFFAKGNRDLYQPSDYILEGYEAKRHIKGENFDLKFCHDLIDFFKESIPKYPGGWEVFDFKFSPTENYANIGEFYNEVKRMGYSIRFADIPASYMDELVNEGKLYLFQIYNKDFAAGSHGKKNMHTLYFESLFSEENLREVVFKLDGEAELFYRPASIGNPVVHRRGEKLVNRTYVEDGKTVHIDDDVYYEIFQYANKRRKLDDVSPEACELINFGKVVIKDVKHEIIKDRRYTEPKYGFHVPITINFGRTGTGFINYDVLAYLKDNPEVNVVAVNRAERHLLYVTVIDQSGKILEQRSLNVVNGVDYRDILEKKAAERTSSRKSWKTINQIKQTKQGYLSAAIHEIVTLMVRHNAILVLEDLDTAFKNSRVHIEKQVYQCFEQMIVEKLGYLAQKPPAQDGEDGLAIDAPGGVLRGYQLANKFESLSALGRQCGFVFFASTWNISRMDPTTGFVNLFGADYLNYSNLANAKEFFGAFELIRYSATDDLFEFTFKYSDFPKVRQHDFTDRWTVCSFGERVVNVKESNKWRSTYVDLNCELKRILDEAEIDYAPGEDIRAAIAERFDASLYRELLSLFKNLMQTRNSVINSDKDYILSPVRNSSGSFFDSRKADPAKEPVNAAANGSYLLALRGLRTITEQICVDDKASRYFLEPIAKGEDDRWLEWMQTR